MPLGSACLHTLLVCQALLLPLAQDSQPGTADHAAWLRENAVAIQSIDPSIEGDDFADLMPLKDLIGEARVVGLGEPSHGDGAHFHAKTRLIKFLHEVMGFDVLVWESGMYSCELVERAIREGEPVAEAWKKGIFGVWGSSEQVQPLFAYIQSTRGTDHPLEIAGADAQVTGQGAPEALRADLQEAYERAGSPAALADELEVVNSFFDLAKIPPMPDYKKFDHEKLDEAAKVVNSALLDDEGAFAELPRRDRAFLARALTNFTGMVEMVYWMAKGQSPDAEAGDMRKYAELREPLFSDILLWQARENYPDRKLVVWAASSHLNFSSNSVEMHDPQADEWIGDPMPWNPMGHGVKAALGDSYYVIDFVAYEGEIGSVFSPARPLAPAAPGTIDALCHESGRPYLFVDFRSLSARDGGQWLSELNIARPRGYMPMRASWPEVCDAFFFTDVMFPSTKVTPADAAETNGSSTGGGD